MTSDRAKVPASACQLAGGEVTFAASDGAATPIRMLARSAEPIEHPWWGRVVHDMDGMKLHKKRIPVDYEHWDPIGYLDKFEVDKKGLWVEGALVSTGKPGDRTDHVVALSRGGVPYEASIYFGGDGIKTEWLGEDQVAEVNGYTFEGPGVIVREWPLRGVAVCAYGADMNTESKFSRSDETFSITPFCKELDMSKDPKKLSETPNADPAATPTPAAPVAEAVPAADPKAEDKPAEDPAPAPAPAEATPALSADRAEAKRFKDAFGERGAVWFAEGLSFEDARNKQIAELSASQTQLQKENAELKAKLAAGGVSGEATPVGFDAGDKKERTGFASRIKIK